MAEAVTEVEGAFALRLGPATPAGLDPREAAVYARLGDGPLPVSEVLRTRPDAAVLDRLVSRGLVIRSGLTPSDAAHLLGLLDAWDGAAAEKALRLIARRRVGSGARVAIDGGALARMIVDQLTTQTADALLEAAIAEDGGFGGEAPEALVAHPLMRAAIGRHSGALSLRAGLGVPVIGLGASAPTYYGAVGDRLGARMLLPVHAGVANAIGAVVGQIAVKVSGLVSSPAEGRYTAHLPDGLTHFAALEQALDAMRAALRSEASARAAEAGAEAVNLVETLERREAEIEGRAMFLEAELSVTASGRPRVAHAD